VLSALTALAALANEQHGPEVLEAVATSLAGKPPLVIALYGVMTALRGSVRDLPLPSDVTQFCAGVVEHIDDLEDHLDGLSGLHATWLTLTVVGPEAVKVAIGWYEDAGSNSGDMDMNVFCEHVLHTTRPVLAFMAIAEMVDDPVYLGYDQTLN
jgi:hypothetical protein